MKKAPQIYVLACPDYGHLRYVGFSTNPEERLKQHMARCEEDNCHRNNWLRSLKVKGLKPIMLIVETVTEKTWAASEIHFIKRARELGFDLVNTTDGGETPPSNAGKKHSPETRKKMSESQKGPKNHGYGKKLSVERRVKLSVINTGTNHPMFGKSPSSKTRKKIGDKLRGRKIASEVCARMGASRLGKKRGPYKKQLEKNHGS